MLLLRCPKSGKCDHSTNVQRVAVARPLCKQLQACLGDVAAGCGLGEAWVTSNTGCSEKTAFILVIIKY